eukprot:3266226-Karenia_brevis.AAC.1
MIIIIIIIITITIIIIMTQCDGMSVHAEESSHAASWCVPGGLQLAQPFHLLIKRSQVALSLAS